VDNRVFAIRLVQCLGWVFETRERQEEMVVGVSALGTSTMSRKTTSDDQDAGAVDPGSRYRCTKTHDSRSATPGAIAQVLPQNALCVLVPRPWLRVPSRAVCPATHTNRLID